MSQETSGMQAPSAHAQLTLRTTQSHTAKVDQQKFIVIPFSFLPKPLDYSPWFLMFHLHSDPFILLRTLRSRLIAGIKDCEFVLLRFSGYQ